jgi:hypothetical protein
MSNHSETTELSKIKISNLCDFVLEFSSMNKNARYLQKNKRNNKIELKNLLHVYMRSRAPLICIFFNFFFTCLI